MAQEFKVGEAPWETQQPQAEFPVGQAPWELEGEIIKNEMPEGLGISRAVVKNLAGSPEAAFNYLQKEHKDFEFKKDSQGEILAKKRGDKAWGRLDPKGFDLQDITDIGADVITGIGQGAATAGAGISAGAGTGGLAALPAAMAASGASGAGLEAIRQALGSAVGLEDNISGKDILTTGAIGAVSPLVFGTGASASQALKAASQAGVKQSADELLASQKGALGRGYDYVAGKVGPKLASLLSGENEKVIKKAGEILPEIAAASKNPQVRTEPLKEVATEIPKILKKETSKVGQRLNVLEDIIDNQPGLVDPTRGTGTISKAEFLTPFEDLAAELTAGSAPTPGQLADLMALKATIQTEFKNLPDNLTAKQVRVLRDRFKQKAKEYGLNYNRSGQTVSTTEGASAINAQIAKAFEASRENMKTAVKQKLDEVLPGSGEEYSDIIEQYSDLKSLARESKTEFKNAKAVGNFFSKAQANDIDAEKLLDIQKYTGVNLEDLAIRDKALEIFSKPATAIRSLKGSTSTTRSVPLSLGMGYLGYELGQRSGGDMSPFMTAVIMGTLGAKAASPAALRKYMELNQLGRTLPQVAPGYQAMPYTLMNMSQDETKGK